MKKKNILPQLLLTFIKIGLFTFGGGYAMISVIENICVEKKKWITHEDMVNVTVIAESTPGPIAINCATFVGYKQAGVPGSIAATFGIVLPSFIVITLISMFFDNFLEIKVIADAFKGIKVGVAVLIIDVAFKMIKKMKKDTLSLILMAGSLCIMLAVNIFSVKFSSISLLIIAAVISLVVFAVREGRAKL